MADGTSNRKPYAIMISVPYQGHINPFVDLALKLASKGFAVTFVHLEWVHHMLSKAHHGSKGEVDIFLEARELGLDIRYTTIGDDFPLEFDRVLNLNEYWESMFHNFGARADEFIQKTINSDPFLDPFLVTDTIYPWSVSIAKKYNLVSVSFWTEPTLVFSFLYHLDLLKEHGHFPCKENIDEIITYLPGVESINTRDLVPLLKEPIIMRNLIKAFEEVKKADFIIHNVVHELESNTLFGLNKYQPNFAIGPVNFSKTLVTPTLSKSVWSNLDCTKWLESKPPNSVLYVSFGSLVQISKHDIEEIAYGLLLSEVNFIWVVRSSILSNGDKNILPLGFEDAVKGKGLIVTWCDQIMVLSNPAVQGFLTHCGWNSTIESIWCGVPMICFPVAYDQPINRTLLVEDWKIGINLCDEKSVHREKVAKKIKYVMNRDTSKGLKEEMEKVKAIMQNATEKGGSSENNFDQFINELKSKIYVSAMKT